MIESALGGLCFGIGTVVGISVSVFIVNMANQQGMKESAERFEKVCEFYGKQVEVLWAIHTAIQDMDGPISSSANSPNGYSASG